MSGGTVGAEGIRGQGLQEQHGEPKALGRWDSGWNPAWRLGTHMGASRGQCPSRLPCATAPAPPGECGRSSSAQGPAARTPSPVRSRSMVAGAFPLHCSPGSCGGQGAAPGLLWAALPWGGRSSALQAWPSRPPPFRAAAPPLCSPTPPQPPQHPHPWLLALVQASAPGCRLETPPHSPGPSPKAHPAAGLPQTQPVCGFTIS